MEYSGWRYFRKKEHPIMTTSTVTDRMNHRISSARRGLILFFALLIPLSAAGYWLTFLNGKWIILLMWAPGLASIIARLALREGIADISLRLGGRRTLRTLPIVFLLPVTVGLAAYGLAWVTGLAHFSSPDTYITAPPIVKFILFLLVNMTAGTLYGLAGSVGEEIGWRGYMLTRLIDARIPCPVLLSGMIWGVWHLPLLVAGRYYTGPVLLLSVIFFMISVTSFGYVMAYLRLSTGSIWPAVFLHAVWNAVTQNVFQLFTQGDSALLWTGESGLFVAFALLAAALIVSRRQWVIIRSLPARGKPLMEERQR
ncbi:CPBP family glutamic-type intramembrane protease [Paenibacillus dendritiformis]|uniref:CPBP family glutamic-type intramembrane protease n=2 Tax=Paenibacillus dendritiformis TaxID=130049 RepID=UPI00387E0EAA